MAEESPLVTLDEIATMTNTHINTVRYWRASKESPFPFARIGRRVMARRADVEAWIERQFEVSA